MDISNIPKDTIVTEEMMNPQKGIRFLVIENPNKSYEKIRLNTEVEIEAYRRFKEIPHKDKKMIRALVTYSDFFKSLYHRELIISYEELERIY